MFSRGRETVHWEQMVKHQIFLCGNYLTLLGWTEVEYYHAFFADEKMLFFYCLKEVYHSSTSWICRIFLCSMFQTSFRCCIDRKKFSIISKHYIVSTIFHAYSRLFIGIKKRKYPRMDHWGLYTLFRQEFSSS